MTDSLNAGSDRGLTTQTAVEAVAWERAPRYPGRRVNSRIACSDGFLVSVQASENHYANDSLAGDGSLESEAPYWRGPDAEVAYPFTTFEIGNPSDDVPSLDEWDSDGVWAWVPRESVVRLLDSHGGAVAWETP
jgi:hypothetical protein